MAPPTILAHKSAFLTAQTIQLSRDLSPSQNWRRRDSHHRGGGGGDGARPVAVELSEKAVDDAVYRLNHTLRQHTKRVYAPQATRHVAEQIEGLYLEAGERASRGEEEEDDDGDDDDRSGQEEEGPVGGGVRDGKRGGKLSVGADFASEETISRLPETWDLHNASEATSHPLESRRYAELTSSLTSLSSRRRELRDRVARLRRIESLLPSPLLTADHSKPLDLASTVQDDDGTDTDRKGTDRMQENLVTRNGEVEKELERMRVLLVRVAGRIGRLPEPTGRTGGEEGTDVVDVVMEDVDTIEKAKVARLLDSF